MNMGYVGAKVALFVGDTLAVIRRDDIARIPWPDYWDLPGGGREGCEAPVACALRETFEELGLRISPEAVVWGKRFEEADGAKWFFAAHVSEDVAAQIVLGDEGQEWALMRAQAFLNHPKAVPQFQDRLAMYLEGVAGDDPALWAKGPPAA